MLVRTLVCYVSLGLVLGCSSTPSAAPSTAPRPATAALAVPAAIGPLACGSATPTARASFEPDITGVVVGPLLFPAVGTTAQLTYDRGGLNKVIPLAIAAINSPILIRGWRCTDGQPLHFLAHLPKGLRAPVYEAQAETIGDAEFAVPAIGALPSPARIGFGGYWLFTTPGLWKIQVADGAHVLGEFVLSAVAR